MVDIEQLREALQHLVIFDARDNISHEVGRAQATSRIVKDSLRELLALKENGQTVWWCFKERRHECQASAESAALPDATWRFRKAGHDECGWKLLVDPLHIHREGT
jgi:hypothetical protein